MFLRSDLATRRSELLLTVSSVFVLAACLYYSYLYLRLPHKGTTWNSATWQVLTDQDDCADPARCLRQGDRILEVGGVLRDDFLKHRTTTILDRPGPVPLVVERDGQRLTMEIGRQHRPLVQTLETTIVTLFPMLFWLLGTVTIILVRPRDDRWRVLILFYYVSALFFSAGWISYTQQALSSYITHFTAALFFPLCVHLHLILPNRSYPRLQKILPLLYGCAGVLILADVVVPYDYRILHLLAFLGMVTSIGLLFGRFLQPASPSVKVANRLMATGSALGLIPWVTVIVFFNLSLLENLPFETDNLLIAGIAMLMLPNWPLSYIYAIYKLGVGKLELRANRALGTYGFWSLYITVYVTFFFILAEQWPFLTEQPVISSLLVSLLFVSTTPFFRQRFQAWVDRYIFGIKFSPSHIVNAFAAKIPVAFERDALRQVVVDEILPTLLIRQSALYFFTDRDRGVAPFYVQELADHQRPRTSAELSDLLAQVERRTAGRPSGAPPAFAWVRLALPLASQDRRIGVWLLGRRDPDDDYPREDVAMLTNLANQIASVFRAQMEIDENRRLQNQLIQSQKMEAIGRLSAGVAHDFNNLLSAILGYSDLLLAEDEDPETERTYLQGIKEAGEKAASLTTQLLAFSRQQAMATQVVDLNGVVTQLETLLRRVLEEDIQLVTLLRDDLPNVRIDPGQLEQVLLNLAVNASDAMEGGGTLVIRTDTVELRPGMPGPGDLPTGSYVKLSVADTGAGIPEEIRDRIFEPFFTTKRLGQGTGLGLSMVYGIISQSKGHITVDSELGRGTTFTLYLPEVDEQITEAPQPAEEDPRPETDRDGASVSPETILLVEDEASVRKVVLEILRAKGYRVLQAEDGLAALELSDGYPDVIHLLLTDVMMPNLKGPELADRLITRRDGLKVLYMSGYNEEALSKQDERNHEAVLIRKPFSPQALLLQVRKALGDRAAAVPSGSHQGVG
ncbi:MAG: ATP-binding protein [Acidobacteriota bacterium]